jgi:hypothetical protein
MNLYSTILIKSAKLQLTQPEVKMKNWVRKELSSGLLLQKKNMQE